MNSISKYVSELLYRYECVILPGFGAFLTRREPAKIQESTAVFFPPKKTISFNSQLQNNDGLLANYMATALDITFSEAVNKIEHYVFSLQKQLAQGQRVKIEAIGSFYTSFENTIQFDANDEVNYLTEGFGLTSFSSPVINREVYKQEIEAIEEKVPLLFTLEKRLESPLLKYAAIAAIIVAVSGFFGLKKVSNNTITHNNNEWQKANLEIESKIQEATFEISNPLPAINLTILKENEDKDAVPIIMPVKFHIIAGAYRVESNARRKINRLKKQGFAYARLLGINEHGLHQVAYESFSDREKALSELARIKREESSKAWLLIYE